MSYPEVIKGLTKHAILGTIAILGFVAIIGFMEWVV